MVTSYKNPGKYEHDYVGKGEEYKLTWHKYKDELPADGEFIISYSFKLYEKYGSGIIADQFNKKVWDEKDEDSKCDLWISEKELRKLYLKSL